MTPITGASERSTYPRSVPDIGDFLGLRDTAPQSLIDASPYPGLDAGQRGPAILATKLNTPANAQTPTRNSGGLGKQRIPSTQPAGGKPWPGLIVTLPNGSSVADPDSITGYLTSPVSDLSAVAAAGRETGQRFRQLQENSETAPGALGYFLARFFHNVATGGAFDYQRSGNQILGLLGAGFTQLPHFRNVSNFNVGLFCHQAGMSLDETLRTAGRYAWLFSGHYDPNQPYGLPGPTRQFIEAGFQTGQSGAFGQP